MKNSWFCKHDWKKIGRHKLVTESLYCCIKCGKYLVHHDTVGVSYQTNKIEEKYWRYEK